jgi:hypothetical protein
MYIYMYIYPNNIHSNVLFISKNPDIRMTYVSSDAAYKRLPINLFWYLLIIFWGFADIIKASFKFNIWHNTMTIARNFIFLLIFSSINCSSKLVWKRLKVAVNCHLQVSGIDLRSHLKNKIGSISRTSNQIHEVIITVYAKHRKRPMTTS